MRTGPTIARGKSKQDYPTPWDFIHACEKKFNGSIAFDLAASDVNAKAPSYYTEADNALNQNWHRLPLDWWHQRLWLNPPFDNIAPWAKKCAEEGAKGARILFLTPASVGSNRFRDYVHGVARVYALNGRIQFVGAEDPYPKDCILSVFGPKLSVFKPGFEVWTWGNELMSDFMFQ